MTSICINMYLTNLFPDEKATLQHIQVYTIIIAAMLLLVVIVAVSVKVKRCAYKRKYGTAHMDKNSKEMSDKSGNNSNEVWTVTVWHWKWMSIKYQLIKNKNHFQLVFWYLWWDYFLMILIGNNFQHDQCTSNILYSHKSI